MGIQGVCGGTAALSKPTSICGTSNIQGGVHSYPTQKLSVVHQQQFGTGIICKFWGELDPVMNQLWCPQERCIASQLSNQKSWPESKAYLLSEQHKPFDPEMTRSAGTDDSPQVESDAPILPRESSRDTKNQLPWRYHNLALQQNIIFSGAFDIWVGLYICFHIISCMYIVFLGNKV